MITTSTFQILILIREWRLKQSLLLTRAKRPDLLAARSLTKEEARLLKEIGAESN
jgi:tRNA (guanine37-N1)-methyltransferase